MIFTLHEGVRFCVCVCVRCQFSFLLFVVWCSWYLMPHTHAHLSLSLSLLPPGHALSQTQLFLPQVSFRAGSLAADSAREFITAAKTALVNAAPGAASAALSQSDQLSIMQRQLLPELLSHDGAAVVAELVALYEAGEIDSDE